MDVRKLVGRNVRRYREQAGISQEELAHRSGLDRTYVSGIERGVRNPTVLVLKDLADQLAVTPAELLSPPATRQELKGTAQAGSANRR
jgi:transcriptional regulator with XRE-family HTH domain